MTESSGNAPNPPDPIDALHQIDGELVIALVGAVGTDLNRVGELLERQLVRTGYSIQRVKISQDVIPLFGDVEYDPHDQADRINTLMTAGNKARERAQDNSVLALGTAASVAATRDEARSPMWRTAFIVNSLKRPEEVERLRKIYPSGFVLLGVHADENRRLDFLMNQGISNRAAEALIERDAHEEFVPCGQRLRRTFYLSDFFVRLDGNEDRLQGELRRIVELLFGHPFHTPIFDEYAMFFAFAAALRSADLSRQVGAVITRDNQILATGANDCPKAGGGLYWPERNIDGCIVDDPRGRDYMRGIDSNKQEQSRIIEGLVDLARAAVEQRTLDPAIPEIIREIMSAKQSPIGDLTEYGRVVHAEMDALLACARINQATGGATLYTTTFPCHNCAKHIVAAGISRVVYIEPYEKSKAPEFHDDSIVFDSQAPADGKVRFEPFVGIGPRRFFDLFSMNLSSGYDIIRKDKTTGEKTEWEHRTARLRVQMLPSTYLNLELEAANLFKENQAHQEGTRNGGETDETPAG